MPTQKCMEAEEDFARALKDNEPVSSSPHLQLSLSSQNPLCHLDTLGMSTRKVRLSQTYTPEMHLRKTCT
jgi:hypothetical protein